LTKAKIFFIIKSMRKIALFLVGLLLLMGGLLFSQKPIKAGIWGECLSCIDGNCCGSPCSSGYFCNNLGYGICYCDKKQEEKKIPPTATPGPRPPGPTQPGGGGGGGGGPTPTEKYAEV